MSIINQLDDCKGRHNMFSYGSLSTQTMWFIFLFTMTTYSVQQPTNYWSIVFSKRLGRPHTWLSWLTAIETGSWQKATKRPSQQIQIPVAQQQCELRKENQFAIPIWFCFLGQNWPCRETFDIVYIPCGINLRYTCHVQEIMIGYLPKILHIIICKQALAYMCIFYTDLT